MRVGIMTGRARYAILCLLLLSSSCAEEPGVAATGAAPTGVARSAIRGGQSDHGDAAVVAVVTTSGLRCTGTLVAPRVVLTAAHCLEASAPLSVRFDDGEIPVSHRRVHPRYERLSLVNDAAVLELAWPSTITPAVLPTERVALQPGARIRLVGFGRTNAGEPSAVTRRMGFTTVTRVDGASFSYGSDPASTCDGDSGGPAFLDVEGHEVLVGVTSFGDEACEVGVNVRTDAFTGELVGPYLALVDAQSQRVGESCLEDQACRSGRCISPDDAPLARYCAAPCGFGDACPAGLACGRAGGRKSCLRPTPSPGALGTPCRADGDCSDVLCLREREDAASVGTCARECVFGSPCDDGGRCVASGNPAAAFICEKPAAAPAPEPPAHAEEAAPAERGCSSSSSRLHSTSSLAALALAAAALFRRRKGGRAGRHARGHSRPRRGTSR